MEKMNDKRIQQIAEALSGLTPRQWDDVCNMIDKMYHPVKKTLTSEEISAMLTKNRNWF